MPSINKSRFTKVDYFQSPIFHQLFEKKSSSDHILLLELRKMDMIDKVLADLPKDSFGFEDLDAFWQVSGINPSQFSFKIFLSLEPIFSSREYLFPLWQTSEN